MKALDNEIFVGVKTFNEDYSDQYLVSNMGRCYSMKRKKFVGYWNKGYFYIILRKNRKAEGMQVGRLMLISFNIPIPDHLKDLDKRWLQASHIDEDSTNNRLENLCWESPKENNSRPMRRQRCSKSRKGKHLTEETRHKMSDSKKGTNHPFYGKFGKDHIRSKPILQYTKDGELIRSWDSIADVGRELGIDNSNITACCKGKLKSIGGYIWRYA